jgi:ubiquinone/menaquinone biosynthesis C-methylase UbiE
MTAYYQARAQEYERIYDKPERQADLARLRDWLTEETRGRTIIEIACGTGYWTAVAAPVARRIVATDINSGPLAIARAKDLGEHVMFREADAYDLPGGLGPFDMAMAHFWWSHVAIADQPRFLRHVASRLETGARLVMIDNRYVEGSSTPLSRTDTEGNTYQTRTLADETTHEVLKNFPSPADLQRTLGILAADVKVTEFDYYWGARADLG